MFSQQNYECLFNVKVKVARHVQCGTSMLVLDAVLTVCNEHALSARGTQ